MTKVAGAAFGIVLGVATITVSVVFGSHQENEDSSSYQGIYHQAAAKRFYSWEGSKRMALTEPSKRKFYAWAGKKRSEGGGEGDMEKRKFYAWAGKRSVGKDQSHFAAADGPFEEAKRKFYAWAGKKRSSSTPYHNDEIDEDGRGGMEKRKFYAWAGRQSLQALAPKERDLEKRKFYAWAGKRSSGQLHYLPLVYNPAEKRKFYAWAGRK